jgi:hypothetical protein
MSVFSACIETRLFQQKRSINLNRTQELVKGILFLGERIKNIFTEGPADESVFQGLEIWWGYNQYPSFDDENNLSFVVFLKCRGVGVLFPGDVEGAGWRSLMATPQFITVLGDTSVLVASHHGRQSGWRDELRKYCNPYYVVISDKGYMHDSQETVPLYRSIAKGGPFRSERSTASCPMLHNSLKLRKAIGQGGRPGLQDQG